MIETVRAAPPASFRARGPAHILPSPRVALLPTL